MLDGSRAAGGAAHRSGPGRRRRAARPCRSAPGVTLDDVADVNTVDGPGQINRVDQARTATVTGTPTRRGAWARSTPSWTSQAQEPRPARRARRYSIGGVTEDQQDAFGDLGLAMLVAIALVFIVMIGTFRGLVQPLILLISIPFAATGALGLLAITGSRSACPR